MWILLIIHLASGQMTQIEFSDYWGCELTRIRLTSDFENWKAPRERLEEWEKKYAAAKANPEISEERRDEIVAAIHGTKADISKYFTEHKTHTRIDAVCIHEDGR